MVYKFTLVTAVAIISCCSGLAAQVADEGTYRLGPQDKVEVRVTDIRSGVGEPHNWPSFDGEFSVNPDGKLSLPLVGEISAVGKSTATIASVVANLVKTEVGLTQLPKVSVQIIKFRPFYILGLVDKPGEYDYRIGLNVMQAISIAGGIEKQSSVNLVAYQREIVSQRGDAKALEAEKTALIIKLARLEADISGAAVIDFGPQIKSRSKDPDVSKVMQQELLLLSNQKLTLKSQRDAIAAEQNNLKDEIIVLKEKSNTLGRQIEVSQKDLSQVRGLIDKGLTVTTRQLAAEQNLASYQNNLLDVQLGSIRASESLSKSARDLIDIEAKHREDTLREASEIRSKIAVLSEKLETALTLVKHAEISAKISSAETGSIGKIRYSITSGNGQSSVARYVSNVDLMQPGDVLNVEFIDETLNNK